MSDKISIKELLEGVEVEWKPLGEITKVLRGRRLTRSQLSDDEKFPVYHGGLEPLGKYEKSNRPANTTMVINVGASAGTVGYSSVDFWSSDGCFCIEHCNILNNKFLYYFLIGQQHFLRSRVRVAGIPTLDAFVVEKIEIPIPSLHIQSEIVRILDNFTELTSELTSELTARKKQYTYYRDKLLTFEDGEVEFKALGKVAKIKNGKDWKNLGEGDIPVYGSGGIMKYVDTSTYNKPSVLIPRKGSLGNLFYVDTPFWNVDTIFYTEIDDSQIVPKFFYYFLTTIGLAEMNQAGGVPSQTQAALNTIKVPIPPLEEQQKIVATLDKFDTLSNSIIEGLPKEIELRTKQYEYYRDLLLTFPKKEVEA
ncbi:restriction endonuclease subunit S [Aliarcobacter butzleri]|uniref:Restriction endonuclease subunit S n=1 Tax=Aliarcobacter butzleri TaxID=28197 RepID=A0AAW6VRF9_9BACT|nr:restriction endonuclease subunit S [Aliarcobacter butzleri]MDK2063125.1 restriction endonuclease subunit S [Aliarcobacter butzleri]